MREIIDGIVERNIQSLKDDSQVISIFLIGSMANHDYKEKKHNDYDIRFIVKEVTVEIYQKISLVLEKIRSDIEKTGILCQVSDIIGPVKITSETERNVLIHGITMTEKDLDDLPSIHKYSYSYRYHHIYGKDIIKRYQGIVILPKDIIDSTEGIEFCINLLKERKNSCNKWVVKDNKMSLEREYFSVDDKDMVELFNYSYKKAYNNIMNMLRTNSIILNINDYLDYTDKEKKLVIKISTDNLNVLDINDNINTMISIMYKLGKCCLKMYDDRKKYYNSLDWGIITDKASTVRGNGFAFLKLINLPTGNNFSISYKDYIENKGEIEKTIASSNYIAILEPPDNSYRRYGITNITSVTQIDEYIKNNGLSIDNYRVSFIEIIKEVKNSFVGVVMADGEGHMVIEILHGTVDTRDLTSTGADISKVERYSYDSFEEYTLGEPRIISEIRDMCQYFKGYYEFAYGNIRGENNVYFTFYSSNEEYINIFKGGKRKWKSIMK